MAIGIGSILPSVMSTCPSRANLGFPIREGVNDKHSFEGVSSFGQFYGQPVTLSRANHVILTINLEVSKRFRQHGQITHHAQIYGCIEA